MYCFLQTEIREKIEEGEEASVRYFQAWNEEVKASVPPDQLLVYNVTEGWDPLCKFLGLPVPPDTPFPRENDTETYTRIFDQVTAVSRILFLGLPTILIFIAVAIYYYV